MKKLSLKELHAIEVTHATIFNCACNTTETGTCSKCGLEIDQPEKIKQMTIAKKVLLDELIENSHIENVENVIFWALQKYYSDSKELPTNGMLVANAIVQRIVEAERTDTPNLQNEETINSIDVKTFDAWEKSDLALDEYLTIPCEIDEELANHIGETCPPKYVDSEFIQGGDPIKATDDNSVLYYMSVSKIGNAYHYLGILPEFKQ